MSAGCLVVYFPHLIVLPNFQRRGIGRELVRRLKPRYGGFHQHMPVADAPAMKFYERVGFVRAADTTSRKPPTKNIRSLAIPISRWQYPADHSETGRASLIRRQTEPAVPHAALLEGYQVFSTSPPASSQPLKPPRLRTLE